MTADNLEGLEKRVDSGEPAAMTALGKLALVGQAGGRSPNDGGVLLAAAAEAGDAEADAIIAVLIGIDARSPSDWALALGYLERAAWRGWQPARKQLTLLCSDRELATRSELESAPTDIWKHVRSRVDIAALTAAPARRVAFETPHIEVIEHFATPAECEWMIARARPRIARAHVFDQQHGGGQYEEARTNSAVLFNILEADFVLVLLHARIAAATGFATRDLEETNVLHYAQGQEFRPHYDFFDPSRPGLKKEIEEKGQRAVTFLVYLNDDFEGGETEFLKLGWRFKGGRGDAIIFRNLDPSGTADTRTLHAGLPPTRGEKWLLSQWIRSRSPMR